MLDDSDSESCGGGGRLDDDCDLMVTGESGQDWMSMPHQHHLCRKNPFTEKFAANTLDFNNAKCDNCWWVVLKLHPKP